MGFFDSAKDKAAKAAGDNKPKGWGSGTGKKKRKISKDQEKRSAKYSKKQWKRAMDEIGGDDGGLYYSCGTHNVNSYTPDHHQQICG